MRNFELHQRPRPDLLHGLLPRRRVHDVRLRRRPVHRDGAGGARRPDGESVPQSDQVHLPQIRPFGDRPEVRRPLRPPIEHRQREDLRVPLVLVHPSHPPLGPLLDLQVRRPDGHPGEALPVKGPLEALPPGTHRHYQQEMPDRGLVRPLPAR